MRIIICWDPITSPLFMEAAISGYLLGCRPRIRRSLSLFAAASDSSDDPALYVAPSHLRRCWSRLKRLNACAQSADTSTPTYNHSKAADKDCASRSSGHEERIDWEVLPVQNGPLSPAASPQRLASGDRVQAGAVGLRPAKVPVYAFFTPSATAQCTRSAVLESLQSLAVRSRLQKPCLIL